MKVADLIAELAKMPPEAEVMLHWDGASRSNADAVWLARGGHVAITDLWEQPVYYDDDRIVGAPTAAEKRYLYAHQMLGLPAPSRDEDDL